MKLKIILNCHGWCESIKSNVPYIVMIALWANPSILRKSSLWILSLKHPHTHITIHKNILLMEFHDDHFRLGTIHKWCPTRVSVQGFKSLGGHFACLCRGFEFYEVKKKIFCHYFSKRKWKYFYTFYHFYSEKSSKRAK